MATDGNVQLPVDSTDNKNKIRVLELTPPITVADGDGTTVVVQEVVALGDDDGYLLTAGGQGNQKLTVELQREILEELRQINRGLGMLGLLLHGGIRPRSSTPEVAAWLDRALARGHQGGQ